MGGDVAENFGIVFSIIFWSVVMIAALAAPIAGGIKLFGYLDNERYYHRRYGTSKVAQFSWLILTAFWVAVPIYYSLYIAILMAVKME